MSIDICFWKAGNGPAEKLYEEACEGVYRSFVASDELVVFREALVDRWPQVRDMMEPLEGDDDPDEIEAMGRYLILTLPFRLAELIPEMRDLAVGAAISGFDPQAEVAF